MTKFLYIISKNAKASVSWSAAAWFLYLSLFALEFGLRVHRALAWHDGFVTNFEEYFGPPHIQDQDEREAVYDEVYYVIVPIFDVHYLTCVKTIYKPREYVNTRVDPKGQTNDHDRILNHSTSCLREGAPESNEDVACVVDQFNARSIPNKVNEVWAAN